MRLRILGCSGGIGAGLRTPSYLLDDTVLLDAGTGVGDLELEEMCHVRHVFLTHSHLDHVAALPLLVDTVFSCRKTPLVVHALPETIRALREHIFNWTIWPDFAELPTSEKPVMVYEPMRPGEKAEVDGVTLEMIPVVHPVPAVAYVARNRKDGRTLCYCGDTTSCDSLWAGLNALTRLDLLLVECAFPDEASELAGVAQHYWPKLLARDLKGLRHHPLVVITHMQAGAEDRVFAECEAQIEGFDLLRAKHGQVLDV